MSGDLKSIDRTSVAKPNSGPSNPPTLQPNVRILLIVSLIVFAFMLADTLLLQPRYETVDDVLQKIVASGMVYVQKPDDHLLLVDAAHFMLGRAFNGLYAAQLDVPWYDLLQWGMLYFANVLFCTLLWSVHRGRKAAVAIVLYLVAVAAPSLNLFQMTTSTAMFGIAGGALIACGLSVEKWNRQARVVAMACGGLVIVLGSFLRYEGAQLAIVLTGMYLFVRYLGREWKKMLVGGAVLLSVCAGVYAVHEWHNDYYARTGWSEFHEFGMQNRKLFDYGRANFSDNQKILAKFGWTANDLKLVKEQLFFCDTVFAPSKINALADECPRFWGLLRPDIQRYLPRHIKYWFDDPFVRIALLAFAGCLAIAGMNRALPAPRILLLMFLGLSLSLAVAVIFKGTQHIYLPILYSVLIAQFMHLRSDGLDYKTISGKRSVLALAVMALLQFVAVNAIFEHNRLNAELNQRQVNNIKLIAYARTQQDKLVFPLLSVIEMSPFQSTRMFQDFHVVTSYSTRNPMGQAMLKSYGISDFKAGILSDKALIISNRKRNQLVSTFFAEHEGKTVRFEPLLVLDRTGQGVYQAVLVNGPVK